MSKIHIKDLATQMGVTEDALLELSAAKRP